MLGIKEVTNGNKTFNVTARSAVFKVASGHTVPLMAHPAASPEGGGEESNAAARRGLLPPPEQRP